MWMAGFEGFSVVEGWFEEDGLSVCQINQESSQNYILRGPL